MMKKEILDNINKIIEVELSDTVEKDMGAYSKLVIQSRAIPDLRDGLKPVQRRILYSMFLGKNFHNKAKRKNAKTVGDVMGSFHPHGDSSIYEALVRMSQPWKTHYPLIDFQGNKGSIDGDGAAAMRYTEGRLDKYSTHMLTDINKDTVDWMYNFDDTLLEPIVLPSKIPNVLLNGAMGIATGYKTDIPPHNFFEIVNAVKEVIEKDGDVRFEDLYKHIKGPDFPTGAIVQGIDDIKKALETGRGKIEMVSKTRIEEHKKGYPLIIVEEIPFDVVKSDLVSSIEQLRIDSVIDGILKVQDETDRTGLRIAIYLKKGAAPQNILDFLFKKTKLRSNYNYQMVVINKGKPQELGIVEILKAYVEHQFEVITRRTQFELKKTKMRLEIIGGLMKAMSILDELIKLIRGSDGKQDSKNKMIDRYDFSDRQSEAIVVMQLHRLSNTDVMALQLEKKELEDNIIYYEKLLSDKKKIGKELLNELEEIVKEYEGDENFKRKTKIVEEVEVNEVNMNEVIEEKNAVLSVTRDGYIKLSSPTSYTTSSNNGDRILDHNHQKTDAIICERKIKNTDTLIAITSGGEYIFLPLRVIEIGKWKDKNAHISAIVSYNVNQKIENCFVFSDKDMLKDKNNIILATKNGYIKRVDVNELILKNFKSSSIIMKMKNEDDEIVSTYCSKTFDEKKYVVVTVSSENYYNKYPLSNVSLIGSKGQGVSAIKITEEVKLSGLFVGEEEDSFVLFTEQNKMKRVKVSDLDLTGRSKRGNRIIKKMKSASNTISLIPYNIGEEVVFIQEETETAYIVLGQMSSSDLNGYGSDIKENKTVNRIEKVNYF